jgi:hypothetical protein
VSSTILFDRDQVERLADVRERPKRLRGSKLLWVDIDDRNEANAGQVSDAFDLERVTCDRLGSSEGKAVFHDFGRYIHPTTYSLSERKGLSGRCCMTRQALSLKAFDYGKPIDTSQSVSVSVPKPPSQSSESRPPSRLSLPVPPASSSSPLSPMS